MYFLVIRQKKTESASNVHFFFIVVVYLEDHKIYMYESRILLINYEQQVIIPLLIQLIIPLFFLLLFFYVKMEKNSTINLIKSRKLFSLRVVLREGNEWMHVNKIYSKKRKKEMWCCMDADARSPSSATHVMYLPPCMHLYVLKTAQ